MKLLLDSYVLLCAAGAPEKLSAVTRQMIDDARNELFFSPATLWEILLTDKRAQNHVSVDVRVLRRGLIDNGYQELAIRSEHIVYLDSLPFLHTDPFDRILIAQAMSEGITLLTMDTVIAQYPGSIQFV